MNVEQFANEMGARLDGVRVSPFERNDHECYMVESVYGNGYDTPKVVAHISTYPNWDIYAQVMIIHDNMETLYEVAFTGNVDDAVATFREAEEWASRVEWANDGR